MNVPNNQDPQAQYNIEYENDKKELNFLDITIRNDLNHSYDFAVFRKSSAAIKLSFVPANILVNTLLIPTERFIF